MHILEIPSFFPPYGGLFCLDQAKALSVRGHEVRILSNVQLGMTVGLKDYLLLPYARYEHEMGGITVLQSYQRGLPRVVRFNVSRWVKIVCGMFDDYVSQYGKPDILHAHCAKWAGYAAMLISRKYCVPYAITEHMSSTLLKEEFGETPDAIWQTIWLREAYQQAQMVIAVSKELVDEIACYYGKDYHWTWVSNTIDTDFFAFCQRPSLEGRKFRFCCLANYEKWKGYDILFAAFRKLREQGLAIELQIAGNGTDSAKCSAQLPEGVVAHGGLDKAGVRNLLYQCDALALATRGETQGLVLLEALCTGIPVVTTEAIPQSVRPSQGCLYVPVDDVDAFAEAMKQTALQAPVDGKRLSEQVLAMASPAVIGKKLEALFSGIIEEYCAA